MRLSPKSLSVSLTMARRLFCRHEWFVEDIGFDANWRPHKVILSCACGRWATRPYVERRPARKAEAA